MTIYLYVKTHKITGLKYLGQTTKDPFKYKGSGKYWLRHLKTHGNIVDTEVLGVFENKEELRKVSILFSLQENIAQSDKWANFMPESGDGITPGWTQAIIDGKIVPVSCEEFKTKNLVHPNKGRKHSNEVNKSKGRTGKRPEQLKENISIGLNRYFANGGKASCQDKSWFYNLDLNKECLDYECPEGWIPGRLPILEQTRLKHSESRKGFRWYHNPFTNEESCCKIQPEGWIPGRIKFKK